MEPEYWSKRCQEQWLGRLTGEDSSALALLIHAPVPLSALGERRLEDEPADVVVLLEVSASLLQLLLLQIGGHVCHLDVGELGLQVLRVHLCNRGKQREYVIAISISGILPTFWFPVWGATLLTVQILLIDTFFCWFFTNLCIQRHLTLTTVKVVKYHTLETSLTYLSTRISALESDRTKLSALLS